MSIEDELTPGGFLWDRKPRKPDMSWVGSRKPEKQKPRKRPPGYHAEYQRKLREKWRALGLVK